MNHLHARLALACVTLGPVLATALGWGWCDRFASQTVDMVRRENGIPLHRIELYEPSELTASANGAYAMSRATHTRTAHPRAPFSLIDQVTLADLTTWKEHLASHAAVIRDAEAVASRSSLAMPPGTAFYEKSGLLLMNLMEGADLLAVRAQVLALEHKSDAALADLATLRTLTDRLNRIPTLAAGRIREATVDTYLQAIAACATLLPPDRCPDLARLLEHLAPGDEERILVGEASKELEAASRSDIPGALSWDSPRGDLWSWQAAALASRPSWAPELALAWQQTLRRFHTQPDDLNQFGKELRAFASHHPASVEVLASGGTPDSAGWYRRLVRRNLAKRGLLTAALQCLPKRQPPDPAPTRDPFSNGPFRLKTESPGWSLYSVGSDGQDDSGFTSESARVSIDLVLHYDGNRLTFAGS